MTNQPPTSAKVRKRWWVAASSVAILLAISLLWLGSSVRQAHYVRQLVRSGAEVRYDLELTTETVYFRVPRRALGATFGWTDPFGRPIKARFESRSPSEAECLAAFEKLKSIHSLDLWKVHVESEMLIQLGKRTSINSLRFCECALPPTLFRDLASFSEVRSIEFIRCPGDGLRPPGDGDLRSVLSLLFGECDWVENAFLASLGPMPSVEELRVIACPASGDLGGALQGFPRLRVLDLSITKIDGDALACLPDACPLETVLLGGTAIDSSVCKCLVRFRNLAQLSLGGTAVGDEALSHVAMMTNLRQLDLSHTGVSDIGIAHLRALESLSTIQLVSTAITDKSLAVLSELPKLRVLDVSGTSISDCGIVHLANCTVMERLDLNDCRISDASIGALAKMRMLQFLNIEGTGISEEGQTALAAALPQCTIIPLHYERICDAIEKRFPREERR